MDRYYKKWFFPLALPSMILFVVVILVPFLLGALYSFTSWRGTYFSGGGLWESFVGLQNYQAAFQNQKFLDAFWYTIKFTVIAVITINVTALALALMVTKISRLSGIFRTIFFLPNMLGGLALGFIWQFIFQIVFSQILFGPESLLPIPFLQNMTQDNTKALLMTRAMAELTRLGEKLGGTRQTFGGLAGMGDLIVTCTSVHSRNRQAGILIGQGLSPQEAMAQVGAVVEGYYATKSAWELCQREGVEMPIVSAAYHVLYENADPKAVVQKLLTRQKKAESEDLGW